MTALTPPLRLAPAELERATAPAAAAWLIAGPDPAAWLEGALAVARAAGVAPLEVGLLVLPGASPGAPSEGALVVPPAGALVGDLTIDARARPYGLFGGRLYLPVDARLEPPLQPAEVARLAGSREARPPAGASARPHAARGERLPQRSLHGGGASEDDGERADVLVLHPAVGLVGFATSDRRGVLDLVTRPPERAAVEWRALPRPLAPLRLAQVVVDQPPTITVFLSGGGEGLGQAPPSELPPAPGETQTPGWFTKQVARAVEWATGGSDAEEAKEEEKAKDPPPAPGAVPGADAGAGAGDGEAGGLLGRLRDWSQGALSVENERKRELERLLHLLETDPDQGLRYALPLGGKPGRGGSGLAPPGVRLPPRRVDFAPGSASGGPGDPWAVAGDLHRRLMARYRELADRELRLGRHRRAAYVYAELLSDLAAAASALEQGRFFREAAALHRDQLGKPLAAARCLERGGLLAEAAELFERERQHLEAGDCWARLERRDDAARCYRRAVDARLAAGDPATAARLIEQKLGAPDEAVAVLSETWPLHSQAGLCLEDLFALWGRLGRHPDALRRLVALRDDERRRSRELALTRALGSVAARYPDRDVQARAQDLVRVVVGERLPLAGPLEADALAQALSRLDPGDRLLARDAGRALAERRKPPPRPASTSTMPPTTRRARRVGWGLLPRRELLPATAGLPASMEALAACSGGGAALLVGRVQGGQHLALLRAAWTGAGQQALQWGVAWPTGGEVLLDAPSTPGAPIVVAGPRRLPPRTLPRTDELPGPIDVGTPVWLPDRTLALASNDQGVLWVLYVADGEQVAVGRFDTSDGHLQGSGALPVEAGELDHLRGELRLVGRREGAYLALDTVLVRLADGAPDPVATFRSRALELVAPLDPRARHLAVGFEDGAALVVPDDPDAGLLGIRFDEDDPPARASRRRDDDDDDAADDDAAVVTRFGEQLASPKLGFTRDGLLLALTPSEGRVYAIEDGRPVHKGTFDGPGQPIVAVLPTDVAREVAIVLRSGVVRISGVTRE